MLNVLDEKWKDHLYDLDQLRNAIQYRAWGQKDPLIEYKHEAFEMFVDLMHDIQTTFTERFLKIQVSAERPEPPRAAATALGPRGGQARGRADQRRGRPVHGPAAAGGVRCRSPRARRRRSTARSVPSAGRPRRCRRSGGTIRVRAGRGRSTRSATGRGASAPPRE